MSKQHLITINNEKDNTLSFDVNFEGIDAEEKNLRLTVATDRPSTAMLFEFEHVSGDTYKVSIPAKALSVGEHDCKVEVIANEHFFVAITGTIKVATPPKISAKIKETVEEKPIEPQVKIDVSEVKIISEAEPTDVQITEPVDTSSIIMTSTQEQIVESVDKSKQVSKILKDLGLKEKAPTKSLKDYLKS